jgi:hypothetical protein
MVSSDFNGDGKSDILWQNDNGQVAIWELNGTTLIGAAIIGNPGPSWDAIATGDFNGDGNPTSCGRTTLGKSTSGK